MKLLIVTQKVDIKDDNLGFFIDWLNTLATKADLLVISNQVGFYHLPPNITVFSLGKERGWGKIAKFFIYQCLLWKTLSQVDGVFFHMCPEYVLSAWFLPKIFRKKSLLWYAHKSAAFKLRLAYWLVDKVFTPSKESFRLPASAKLEITGHGIDVDKFIPQSGKKIDVGKIYRLISVGRLAPVKNIHILIEAAHVLRERSFQFDLKIAGAPITEIDKKYQKELLDLCLKKGLKDKILFTGPIANSDIVSFYQGGDLLINLSDTGSMDKAVLEAMSCGLEILTANEAFLSVLPPGNIVSKDPHAIAEEIISLSRINVDEKKMDFRKCVINNHSLRRLVEKIIRNFV